MTTGKAVSEDCAYGQCLETAVQVKIGPGNDQLIVLISDGAEFNPKGDDATGEAIEVTRDALAVAVRSGPPPAELSDETWYNNYD